MTRWKEMSAAVLAFFAWAVFDATRQMPRRALAAEAPEEDSAYVKVVKPFLESHCITCHGEKVRKSGLRLDTLTPESFTGGQARVWREVVDRINAGEMPPEGERQPDPKLSVKVAGWVELRLREERVPSRNGHRNTY